ncbi:MAG: pantetheine-phosphate adenylyltransferase [Candidatus Omnitrophica bacterium]|nr:pantetheine-phosphate adenylyltransferase [Candidatus Omnitrophota bacterium]
MKRVIVYPGSFDPVTYGHLDIIKRALKICDQLIIAVSSNPTKKSLLSLRERILLLKETIKEMKDVRVEEFDGLLVDFLKRKGVRIIIRGLRAVSDFEYEFQMVLANRKLDEKTETIFMMPTEAYFYLSSSLVKELAGLGADISRYVPKFVEEKLKEKISHAKSQKKTF